MPPPVRRFPARAEFPPSLQESFALLAAGKLREALVGFDSEPKGSPVFSLALGNAGLVCRRLGHHGEAEKRLKAWARQYRKEADPHPPSTVQFIRNLGEAVGLQGRTAEACATLGRALSVCEELSERYPEFSQDLLEESAHVHISLGAFLRRDSVAEAVENLQIARDIFRSLPVTGRVGHAEALSNLADAYAELGQLTEAHLAFCEAVTIAGEVGNEDEVARIRMNALMGGIELPGATVEGIRTSIAEARGDGRLETAYVRCIQLASILERRRAFSEALEALAQARAFEDRLDPRSLLVPQQRRWEAQLAEAAGQEPSQVVALLIDCGSRWMRCLKEPLSPVDFGIAAEHLHDDLRVLTDRLLRLNRIEEAFCTAETNRALLHRALLRGPTETGALASRLFDQGSFVETGLLESIQRRVGNGELLVSLVILPPDVLAFVVSGDSVDICRVPSARSDRVDYDLLAGRLEAGKGIEAVPPSAVAMASALRGSIGDRTIRAIVPYGALHAVPWRALLRAAGLPWLQLRCQVEFDLAPAESIHECGRGCGQVVALGHGGASEQGEFAAEAAAFVELFGTCGHVETASGGAVTRWLASSADVVLLSVHGRSHRDEAGQARLVLELADGLKVAEELVPTKSETHIAVLSACHSGVYEVTHGQFPMGFAPDLLRAGVRHCIGARYEVGADFAHAFVVAVGMALASGTSAPDAFSSACEALEREGWDLWRNLAGVEIVGRE